MKNHIIPIIIVVVVVDLDYRHNETRTDNKNFITSFLIIIALITITGCIIIKKMSKVSKVGYHHY